MEKFLAFWDTHVGFERRGGSLRPIHDEKAINCMLKFAADFKPDHVIAGGDILDCGAVSHHHTGKPGKTEGLKLAKDGDLAHQMIIQPLESIRVKSRTFITGNHERFIDDTIAGIPGLEGCFSARSLMGMNKSWNVVQLGGLAHIGKLFFAHGDQIKGGEHCAKAAVVNFDRNIMFGHHHTLQLFSKNTPVFEELPKVGVAVPCLCTKDQNYGGGKPNRWSQGFVYGYTQKGGNFSFYIPIIIGGKTIIGGKEYRG